MKEKFYKVWFKARPNQDKYFRSKENAELYVKNTLAALSVLGVNLEQYYESIHYGIDEKVFENCTAADVSISFDDELHG